MSNKQGSLIKILGANIAVRRKALGMSQEILAEKIGITQQALARMEQGKIAPKLTRLPELAGALQCTVAELITAQDGDTLEASSRLLAALEKVPAHKQEAFIQHVWLTVELMG